MPMHQGQVACLSPTHPHGSRSSMQALSGTSHPQACGWCSEFRDGWSVVPAFGELWEGGHGPTLGHRSLRVLGAVTSTCLHIPATLSPKQAPTPSPHAAVISFRALLTMEGPSTGFVGCVPCPRQISSMETKIWSLLLPHPPQHLHRA